jgi:hypothetical protein
MWFSIFFFLKRDNGVVTVVTVVTVATVVAVGNRRMTVVSGK